MAETDLPDTESQPQKKKGGGMMPVILAFVIVTLVGGGGGALLGTMLGGSVPAEGADPAAEHGAEAPAEGHGHEGEKAKADPHGDPSLIEMADEKAPLTLVPLKPVLTNIYNPAESWIRIEAAIVIKPDGEPNPEVLAAEIEADTLAFARSLQIAQVEGTRGLLHLRDDLRERAKLRSPAVVDYLIQAMVVE